MSNILEQNWYMKTTRFRFNGIWMNLLKERGTKYIYAGTDGKNIASQALYRSVGFLKYGMKWEWQNTL